MPLEIVAKHRATYYTTEERNNSYYDEFHFVMNDDFEGIDWLLCNMDWDDVKGDAKKVNDVVLVTDDEFFRSSDGFEIYRAMMIIE